jgi:fatty acid amide hydrolase
MRQRLEAGEVSSVELVQACIDRIEAIDPKVNAVPIRRFGAALEEARKADAARKSGTAGALAGIPMTVKENLELTGFDTTMGLRGRQGKPAPRDAVVIEQLRAAGAVVLGKTNVPQFLLAQETENDIWGVTRNPFNPARVPGGSSGGEAAAIATGMAPWGLGTDIGGSIRIPCHFTGIYGIKPTVDAWSMRGSIGGMPGQELVRAQMGPMARTVDDLVLMSRTLDPRAMSRLDPGVPPLPPPDPAAVDLKGLRIGWHDDDGYLTPAPPLRRAVALAKAALEAAGAELVPFRPVDEGEVLFLWVMALSSDGGQTLKSHLQKGEAFCPQLKPSRRLQALPGAARKALAAILDRTGEARIARLLRGIGEKSVADWWRMAAQRTAYRQAEFDAWRTAEIDAMICPAHVVPAMPHRESGEFVAAMTYPFRYAFLNFPAGVAPMTTVNAVDVQQTPAGNDKIEKQISAFMQGAEGLPVGVQVVAPPYRESAVLAVMAALEAARAGADDMPKTPVTL